MSTIAAGTTSGTALVSSGDTTGQLVLQTNGSTTAVTIATNQVVTLAQPLPVGSGGTGATSLSGLTVGTATSATTATNLASGSAGTIPYQSAAGTTQMLAVGSAGQVLQTNGAGAPTWVAAGGGSWVFLSTVTASSASTVDVETTFDATYDMYAIVFSGFYFSSGGASNINLRLKVGGSYITSANYGYAAYSAESTASNRAGNSGTATAISTTYGYNYGGNLSNLCSGFIYVQNPTRVNSYKTVWGDISGQNSTSFTRDIFTGGVLDQQALTGVRFLASNGSSLITGTFRLYGIKNS